MKAALLLVLSLATTTVAAQQILVVDASGGTPYQDINDARHAANPGDTIHVRAGSYRSVLLTKPLNVVGIAPRPEDVVIFGSIEMYDLGPGTTSRCARMQVRTRSTPGQLLRFPAQGSTGTLVLDRIEFQGHVDCGGHAGTVAFNQCTFLGAGPKLLTMENMSRVLMHDCDLIADYSNYTPQSLPAEASTSIENSTVDISHSRLRGLRYAQILTLFTPGGPALRISNSTVTISGLPSDLIEGGAGHTGSPQSSGGFAVEALNSTLTYSGATLQNGPGNTAPHPVISVGSVVRQVSTAPVVTIAGGASRALTLLNVTATPGSSSLTWLGLELAPGSTPFGVFYLNPATILTTWAIAIPASGQATFPLDLRSLPPSLVGPNFVLQTASLDPNANLQLSGPFVGTIAF